MPTFRHLRTRLTVAFGGVIALILIAITATVLLSVRQSAFDQVHHDLDATASVHERIWHLTDDQLAENASTLAADFGFRGAVATADIPTISSALDNLRSRLDIERAFVVLEDGGAVQAGRFERLTTPPEIFAALQAQDKRSGVLEIGGRNYQGVSVPVLAPDKIGWVIFARELGDAQMLELEDLSPIPLAATIEPLGDTSAADRGHISAATPLDAFTGGQAHQLVLRYPLALAMKPFNEMATSIATTATIGVLVMLLACWMLSRTVTNPVAKLEIAARQLGETGRFELALSSNDEIGRLASSFSDMASKVSEREARIRHMSMLDVETELPNRRALEAEITALGEHPDGQAFVVAVASIERFAKIRSAIGHEASNSMVSSVGARLIVIKDVVAIGRLASHSIGLLVAADSPAAAFEKLFALNLDHSHPLTIGNESVDVQLTIGIGEMGAAPGMSLIDQAMVAQQQATSRHVGVAMFDAQMYGNPSGTLSLMSEMLTGLEDDAIHLAYQPKYDLRSNKITSLEALLRWEHPRLGRISPEKFVNDAEETGHIRPLSEWVVRRAIEDRALFCARGYDLKIALNLSGRLVTDDAFVDWSIAALAGMAEKFCFEITETAVINDVDTALHNIQRMRDAGLEISIDDYGAGLSSLTYLKQIPAHELKIDKSFILALEAGSSDALLVKSTIDLAHSLGLRVTAEGVETQQVMQLLAAMGADVAQGYFIARPARLEVIADLLDDMQENRAETDAHATSSLSV